MGSIKIILANVLIFMCQTCTVYCYFTTPKTTTKSFEYEFGDKCVNIETPPLLWHKNNIPNPQTDTCKSGRHGNTSWVCDPNNLMTFDEENRIDDTIETLRRTTGKCQCGAKKCANVPSNYGGFQASVVLLSAIYVNPGDSAMEAADELTDHLRDDAWKFGACNDDLVILVSDKDRVVYTATGDLTREIVHDECVDQITQHAKTHLAAKHYGQALLGMVHEYNQALQREHSCNKPLGWAQIGIIIGIIGGTILSCITCGFVRRKFGLCQNCGSASGGNSAGKSYHSARRGSNASAKSASSGGGGDTF